ncbi:MAG TPA: hypothetical protein PKA88_23090 [Polyangiaceae bacterium]|nr:hypothetical protein [Polyangiaceae bacterium]
MKNTLVYASAMRCLKHFFLLPLLASCGHPKAPVPDWAIEQESENADVKACEAGDGAGCLAAGNRMFDFKLNGKDQGYGKITKGTQNKEYGAVMYERGCELGQMVACSKLGSVILNTGYYYRDLTVDEREAEAEPLFEKGCSAKHAPACRALVELFRVQKKPDAVAAAKRRLCAINGEDYECKER